ncbi:MAG TPA: DUF3185 domain-containing protein [Verrucomicrobiae bacterium]|nr:DUF3185 domain-containing protein [Verrucomicrobiae bacterium]
MSQLRSSGLALIVLGILSFSYQGFITYRTREKVIDAGPVQITTSKTHKIRVPELAGAIALIGGVSILVASVKKT